MQVSVDAAACSFELRLQRPVLMSITEFRAEDPFPHGGERKIPRNHRLRPIKEIVQGLSDYSE